MTATHQELLPVETPARFMTIPLAATSTILSRGELQQLTGYQQAIKQLAELQRQGFYRARRSRVDGGVILERSHYDAVCAGAGRPANAPQLRPISKRKA